MLNICEEVYSITPTRWYPHNTAYASNEEGMLDWQDNLKEDRDRYQTILQDVSEDINISAASYIGHVETQVIEKLLEDHYKHLYIRVLEEVGQI